ncbi:MAG: HEPN domain-containing protein, partial [Ignisphaera sp.]
CAEKALKALLLARGRIYHGHDLLDIACTIREDLGLDIGCLLDDLRELTVHYTVARYTQMLLTPYLRSSIVRLGSC